MMLDLIYYISQNTVQNVQRLEASEKKHFIQGIPKFLYQAIIGNLGITLTHLFIGKVLQILKDDNLSTGSAAIDIHGDVLVVPCWSDNQYQLYRLS